MAISGDLRVSATLPLYRSHSPPLRTSSLPSPKVSFSLISLVTNASRSLSQYAYILIAIPLMMISTPNYTQTAPFEGSGIRLGFVKVAAFP